MTRAAARRCLLTLEELGYLAHDGKFFTPRPRLRRLGGGNGGRDAATLAERAQPVLEEARDRINEPVAVAVLDGRDVLFIARAEATRIVSTGVRVGGRLPAYCSATGRILLADMAEDELGHYLNGVNPVARTPHTIVDPDHIRAKIQEARESGVSYSDEELELGMRSMAVPIRDSEGCLLAARSHSTSASRVGLDVMTSDYLPVLNWTARRLT